MNNIEDIRKNINEIDRQLVELFEKRMRIVSEVAVNKAETGRDIYDSKREQEVIRQAIELTKNKELASYTKEFFENLMDISKKYQHQMIPAKSIENTKLDKEISAVGFQGVSGSFSDSAVDYLYDQSIERKNYATFEDLFKAVQSGEVIDGVFPYENTSTGGVSDVLDLLRQYDLYIIAQFDVRISQCLLGTGKSSIETLKYVYSHPQGLLQCAQFFKNHESITPCPYTNTAAAAKDVSIWDDETKGAIASKKAASLYHLNVLIDNLEDNKKNTTRFIVVNKKLSVNEGASKTSLIFTAAHEPGALFKILKSFYENDVNITRIESRPNNKRNFEYFFYLDFEGTILDSKVSKALESVKNNCGYFKILGSYVVKGESR
ncbi:MAG: chorismate mutase [Clostridia bacterium]|nr:chorismate mutase [Clostridia bacterium]